MYLTSRVRLIITELQVGRSAAAFASILAEVQVETMRPSSGNGFSPIVIKHQFVPRDFSADHLWSQKCQPWFYLRLFGLRLFQVNRGGIGYSMGLRPQAWPTNFTDTLPRTFRLRNFSANCKLKLSRTWFVAPPG